MPGLTLLSQADPPTEQNKELQEEKGNETEAKDPLPLEVKHRNAKASSRLHP